jgi:SAM domain (Sterile alpha motif)
LLKNKIDLSVLPHLTDQDLKDIGVSLGHRRKMLAAIAGFVGLAQTPTKPASTESKPKILPNDAKSLSCSRRDRDRVQRGFSALRRSQTRSNFDQPACVDAVKDTVTVEAVGIGDQVQEHPRDLLRIGIDLARRRVE